MAGLLDFGAEQPGGIFGGLLSDPGARLGLSMLAASSPRLRGLNDVMASQDRMQQQALQQQYLQSQLDENKSQAKLREQQVAMAQQKQNMLANLFGGGGGGPLAGVSTGGGINVPASGGGGGMQNMTLDQVAMLKANGIDVADLWKTGREGFKREAGAYYEGVNGDTKYMPKLDSGMAVSGGQVVVAPGYAQANAGIKGSEAGAVEAAKFPYAVGQDSARQNLSARLDATKVYNPRTGREEFVPRSAVVAQSQFSGAGYAGGSAAAAAPEQLQIMQSELNRLPPNHPDRPAIMREMQRIGGGQQVAQSGNFAAGPTASEAIVNEAARVKAVKQTEADITPTSQKIAAFETAGDTLKVINKALSHPGLGTATGLQGTADPRNYIPGTDAKNFRVLMDQIKGSVFLDAYKDLRGGGAITEAEGVKAEAAKARINNAQSTDEFVAGLKEYRGIVERGYQRAANAVPPDARRQSESGSQASQGSWGDKPIPQAAINDLKMRGPKAKAQFDEIFGPGAADRALGGK